MALKLLVGAYSSPIITTLLFNPSASSLSLVGTSQAGPSPSWIVSHPTNKSILFATQDVWYSGGVMSFFVKSDGTLTQLATANSGGIAPPHIGVSDDGTQLFVPNVNQNLAILYATQDLTLEYLQSLMGCLCLVQQWSIRECTIDEWWGIVWHTLFSNSVHRFRS
jgi:6-phosphogluconolactonase (cycloisomerase 2 family)